MTWWEAIILGIVEGLTEYLPVSSTGHLLVTQWLLGIGTENEAAKEAANAFAICIQGGAILAVLGLYWKHVTQALRGIGGKLGIGAGDVDGWRLFVNLMVAFVPAAVIGKLFDDKIEAALFSPRTVVIMWAVGGVAILLVDFFKARTRSPKDDEIAHGEEAEPTPSPGRAINDLTWQMALIIGLLQCVAMVPGTSRSLMTIVAGILVGLRVAAAVEFSFLLGVITLGAATLYKAFLDSVEGSDQIMLLDMLDQYGWWPMLAGNIAAFVSAALAIKWLVGYLKKHGMMVFGWYRIVIALVIGGLLLSGTSVLG